MADPENEDAPTPERYPSVPELEVDETVAPRPEEDAADVGRSAPAPRAR